MVSVMSNCNNFRDALRNGLVLACLQKLHGVRNVNEDGNIDLWRKTRALVFGDVRIVCGQLLKRGDEDSIIPNCCICHWSHVIFTTNLDERLMMWKSAFLWWITQLKYRGDGSYRNSIIISNLIINKYFIRDTLYKNGLYVMCVRHTLHNLFYIFVHTHGWHLKARVAASHIYCIWLWMDQFLVLYFTYSSLPLILGST